MNAPDWVIRQHSRGNAAGILLVARPTRRVLLLRRRNGDWDTPGGMAESWEPDAFTTAMRELREETGYGEAVVVAKPRFQVCWRPMNGLMNLPFPWFGHMWPDAQLKYTGFVGYIPREFKPRLDQEHVSAAWKKIPEAPEALAPGVDWYLSWVKTMKLA